tara:strand:+ start:21985 stop:22149 length:165 start_codon:yes stop_codon:yes gene_type:complete
MLDMTKEIITTARISVKKERKDVLLLLKNLIKGANFILFSKTSLIIISYIYRAL